MISREVTANASTRSCGYEEQSPPRPGRSAGPATRGAHWAVAAPQKLNPAKVSDSASRLLFSFQLLSTNARKLRRNKSAHGPAARSAEWDFTSSIAHGPAARSAESDFLDKSNPRTRLTVCRTDAKMSSAEHMDTCRQYTFTVINHRSICTPVRGKVGCLHDVLAACLSQCMRRAGVLPTTEVDSCVCSQSAWAACFTRAAYG